MKDLKEAYRRLADAQANNDSEAATAAWEDIGRIIEALPDDAAQLPAIVGGLEFEDDEENLTPDQKQAKVLSALYEAALSGNVPAILKYLELRPRAEGEPAQTKTNGKPKRTRKPRKSRRLSVKEVAFIDHYFECEDCKGNATKAAGHAGFKGSANVLAVTGYNLLRKPKIQEYVVARLEASALSIEETLRGISETAAGIGQHLIDVSGDVPRVNLKKVAEAGKLHLIKSVVAHPNGQIKAVHWDSPLQAKIALARYHQLTDPGKPPDEELTQEELTRIALARARTAIEIVMKIAKKNNVELTLEQAAEKAAEHGFTKAKEVIRQAPDFSN